MDSFDELLDEFEKSYCQLPQQESFQKRESDVDNFLDSPLVVKKCFPPYLSGTFNKTYPKPCSALRCIQCDFEVVIMHSLRWLPETDYYFLRNNIPNREKLSKQLEACEGATAYACQCKSYTAETLISVNVIPQLQWICRGH